MSADLENMGYKAVSKIVSWIKMAAGLDKKVPQALRTIVKLKMVADFEHMGYEAVPKAVSWIKMAAGLD